MSNQKTTADDPCQYSLALPGFQPFAGGSPPVLPAQWQCTALLHPFSPPPTGEPQPDTPFFQLCTANIEYSEGNYLQAQITGCSDGGTWWYWIDPNNITHLSRDGGTTWNEVETGWTLPTTNWFGGQAAQATCVGTAPLNWMATQEVNWWKIPVASSPAATWMWFNAGGGSESLPFRLMFGQPPPQPTVGDPNQLALFQMYSFTYFPTFNPANLTARSTEWNAAGIEGFVSGNPENYQMVLWNNNFGTTTFMTPVNEGSNPLPTRMLYTWATDAQYQVLTDRAQNTLMWYYDNPDSNLVWEEALLFGIAPAGVPPPQYSGTGFIIDQSKDGSQTCNPLVVGGMPLGQEPPNWASLDGTIQACITNNPTLCPNEVITVIAEIFPPTSEYPQGTYLWTWYSPQDGPTSSNCRPVTFMQSASQISVGTSLALADYYDYQVFVSDPSCFQVPASCSSTGGGAKDDSAGDSKSGGSGGGAEYGG